MPAFAIRSSILWKFAVAIVLVALGDWMVFQHGWWGGYLGFYAMALAAGLAIGNVSVQRDWRAWLALAGALVFAGAFAIDPSLLAWTLFWTALSMAALLPYTARFGDGWQWFQRLLLHALRSPFVTLIDLRRASKVGSKRPRQRRERRPLTPLLALPVMGTLTFLFLFASANPVLAKWFYSVQGPNLDRIDILRPLLWFLLFTMAWCVLRPRMALRLLPTFDGRGDLPLPGVSAGSMLLSLVAFNLVFALQNAMDIVYLWGEARLPGDMTMADYAHRGAYPLMGTALLAALFVLVTLRPGSSTAQVPAIRRLVMLWVAQNIFLVSSSIERMIDYVGSYSLTELRITVLCWMALVAFGLAAICWRMLADKSAGWLINVNLAAATALLTFAAFVDLGTVAAQWNVRHSREAGGKAVNLDLCYLNQLGSSSLLPLLELERNPKLTPEYRERVQAVRQEVYRDLVWTLKDGFWSYRDERRLAEAQKQLAAIPAAPTLRDRNCDGTPFMPDVEPPPVLVTQDDKPLSTLPPAKDMAPDPKVSRQPGPSVR